MENWYIYYQISPAQAQEIAPRLRAMLDQIADATGVRGRLLRQDDGGHCTLLECYEDVRAPEQFAPQLAEALTRAQFPATLRAERHLERFCEI